MKPLRVWNRYQLCLRLGHGGFGDVYQAHDLETGQEVAMKLEDPSIGLDSPLQNEILAYEELAEGVGIPRLYCNGEQDEYKVMTFELLGPSLESLFLYCGGKFSLKTVLMLGDQLITRFQYIHSKGFIHCDIKPGNLLMGDGKQCHRVYVTDFGLAGHFEDEEWRQMSRSPDFPTLRSWLMGTPVFASVNSHLGNMLSPRDDMESLGYVLWYLLQGSLPWHEATGLVEAAGQQNEELVPDKQSVENSEWQGLEEATDPKAVTDQQQRKLILEKKLLVGLEDSDLLNNLPEEFGKYFKHIRSVGSNPRPNYAYLRRLFRGLFRRKGFDYDHVFDWVELKFFEELEKKAAETSTSPT